MISFKGHHHQQDIILQCVRWYVAYALSYRDLEGLMQERGYTVDHSTIQRWVVHYALRIEKAFRKRKKRTGHRWRMGESFLKIKGQWKGCVAKISKRKLTLIFRRNDPIGSKTTTNSVVIPNGLIRPGRDAVRANLNIIFRVIPNAWTYYLTENLA